jgi:glycosyltransferase involved in cell wall biosynthesis
VRFKYGRGVDAFIAISQAVRNAMVVAGIDSDRIEVVYSGVPAPQVKQPRDWRSELGWPSQTVVCGIVGAMTREKGLDSISAIARGFTTEVRARIRVVLLGGKGKGAFASPELEGFDAGFVEEIHDSMAGLDMLWHPARSEGLGTAVIDAMALGVPPVAFGVGGLPEVIVNDVSGRLISPGSVSDFSAAVAELVTDDALRQRLAEGARKRAREFDSQAMIERTAEVYQRVAGG